MLRVSGRPRMMRPQGWSIQAWDHWGIIHQSPSLFQGCLWGVWRLIPLEFLACFVLEEQTTVFRESPQAKRRTWWHLKVELVRADMASREWGTSNICTMMLFTPIIPPPWLPRVKSGTVFLSERGIWNFTWYFLILKVWQPIYIKKTTKITSKCLFLIDAFIGLRKIWVWFPFQVMNLIKVSPSLSSGP